ncbi:MAG: hypothetical protein Q4B58_06765 [Bacteroidales bacterium]|nr:hypothetical protein [Bacteroidales bacterium]
MIKNFLQKIASVCFLALGIVCLSSCMDGGDSDVTVISHATIGTDPASGYRFYLDSGEEAILSGVNAQQIKDARRAMVQFSFDPEKDLQKVGDKSYINGKFLAAVKVDVDKILTQLAANDKNLLARDSVYTIESFKSCWASNGYLCVECVSAYANMKVPTATFFYNNMDLKADTLQINVAMNRHSTASVSGQVSTFNCLSLSQFAQKYGYGRDSVVISIRDAANGSKLAPANFKVSAKAFLEPELKY